MPIKETVITAKDIKGLVDIKKLNIYLKPYNNVWNNPNSGVSTKYINVGSRIVYKEEDPILGDEIEFIQRKSFEVVALYPGEVKETNNNEIEIINRDWDDFEYIHIPIGYIEGYSIGLEELQECRYDKSSYKHTMRALDSVSDELLSFGEDVFNGNLLYILDNDYDDLFLELPEPIIYLIENISFANGFDDIDIELATLDLLRQSFVEIHKQEILVMIHSSGLQELTSANQSIDNNKYTMDLTEQLIKEDYIAIKSQAGYRYHVKEFHSSK